jgi:hypothetical protein
LPAIFRSPKRIQNRRQDAGATKTVAFLCERWDSIPV